MTTETGAPGTESGAEFRQKFEATQAENAGLRSTIAEQLGVSADDLKGVPADQMKTKAEEILAANVAAEQAVLRKHLNLGPDDDLEAALTKLRGGEANTATTTEGQPSAPTPFTSTGSLGGQPPGAVQTEGLFGIDRIRAGLEKRKT